ncbi:Salicylate 1-monooxygenase [Ascochyta rabiei]|uniref:Oxidoreductase n=1 Tax=Didymella rabiei TaxID=5454 RepID=A0A163JM01_DIDRA|nr:Salicylate 1-monooxygenase [Ascochyta rabiei]KZM26447.1 oxidoreductase [Ascochyta rabiei]UPX11857.1 Salicylate 1-monooxygenase [Ascochyta rabiei]
MPGIQKHQLEREPPTGVSVLVVGAGIGGLSFAIEAHRKGHDVRVIERSPEGQYSGEIIMITTPALITPKKWPGFMERARAAAYSPVFDLRKFDGTHIKTHAPGDAKNPSLGIYRRKLHNLLYTYAKELDIPITFETRVVEYFETEDFGGVTLDDGQKLTADVVVAADGVGSKSRAVLDGNSDAPISSGFIIYRIAFPVAPALENPIIAKELAGHKDRGFMYIGPGAHMLLSKGGDDLCWLLTTKDEDSSSTESWSKSTTTERALKAVDQWDPFVKEVVKATPDNRVLDWKLMWRNPQPQWTSSGGRIVQLGDAAHPFLPTSFSGATMAMEDAYSLAACLHIGGKKDVTLATKIHNKLRFERVSCAQKMGFKNREVFHNTNWEQQDQDSKPLKNKQMVGNWLINHDPEQYAYDNYHSCAQYLLTGAPFENTNLVPGYKYKPWTVKELLGASERGEVLEDEGDWS